MLVSNKTPFPVIAFCWSVEPRFGSDVYILPDQTLEVSLTTEGSGMEVCVEGGVVCEETPTHPNAYRVALRIPLIFRGLMEGVTVRHHHDERDEAITLTLPRMKNGR